MTYIEFYICCVIANIVLCIPALALGNMDGGSENGFKDITIKDIGISIGIGIIPLFNFISAAIFAFVVVTYPIAGLCMNIGKKDFWNIHPFEGKKKPVKEETNFERKMKLAQDCYEEMSGVRNGRNIKNDNV